MNLSHRKKEREKEEKAQWVPISQRNLLYYQKKIRGKKRKKKKRWVVVPDAPKRSSLAA